jgi:hypothetical protein
MNLKQIKLVCLLGIFGLGTASAQWTDITSEFLQNSSFENNSKDGWTWTSDAVSQTADYNCMEFWNGTFDFWQKVSGLPQGTYRLSVQGYYREGDNDVTYQSYLNEEENLTAELYAGEYAQPLVSVYSYEYPREVSGCWTYSSGGWFGGERHYFPNNMYSASVAFANGAYRNSLEFETDGGDVQIGVKNEVWNNSNWCIFDNFKLEYKGTAVKVQSVTLDIAKTSLLVGEVIQCTATVLPDNALFKRLVWTSDNEDVVTVDQTGLISATGVGTATISAATVDGTNIVKTVTVEVKDSEVTSLAINEIMVSNVDEYVSPAYNFDGWVEFYNPTDRSISLAGLYLSDDANNLMMWRIPAKAGLVPIRGYKVVWFDSNDIAASNAPFKLKVDGGSLYLSNSKGTLLASLTYPAGRERISYARTKDGDGAWAFTGQPTPGASNTSSVFAASQLDEPLIDTPSKLFESSFTATVTIPVGATLRYTLDGSLPTLHNGMTSTDGIFQISETTNLRLRLFADDKLPSRVTTRSYILKTHDFYLPIVSVVGNNDHLYSDEMGVLVKGTNGIPGHGDSSPWNTFMNWQRPVNFSYMIDGDMVFNQDVNLEMCGGWSRKWMPRAFKLKGNKELGGNKDLLYPFFTQKPYVRNKTLQIRNGGNDNNCRFRDPALQYIVQSTGINLDCQSYQPVHEFVNGEYMGVLNMREPNNKDFVYSNYGWDDDEIDLFEMEPDSGYVQKCGTPDSFNELIDFSEDAANSETYKEICQLLDIDAYANYMGLQFYLRNWDWPQNNVKGFRYRDGGKFRFVLFDLDGVFSVSNAINQFIGKEWYQFDQLYPTSLGRRSDYIRFVTLFKNLSQNPDFCRKFVDAYCMMGGSVYTEQRSTDIINELAGFVYPGMQIQRWESPWSTANQLIQNLANRPGSMLSDLLSYYPLGLDASDVQYVTLNSDTEGAQILVNGMKVPTGQFNGYLFAPATLKAVAPAGYVFQGWGTTAPVTGKTLIANESVWSYYDQGSLDSQNWTAVSYNERGWQQGQAPLGYNNPNVYENTVVDYQTQKYTFYFRTSVSLDKAPANTDEFWLDYQADDGFVVYVNGVEAGRYNMPSGTVSYYSFANHYAHGNPDAGSLQLPSNLFRKGNNVIAVEVHNESLNSSDILWEASLRMNSEGVVSSIYSTDAEISLPEGSVSLTATYRAMTPAERSEEQLTPVRINELSASNSIHINEYGKKNDWVELYNTTDEEIDVEGMYLTDNVEKPTKYQITKGSTNASTKIPAHGYLLVWCDKLATTDQALHASFKIGGDGGYLMLSAADCSWTDKMVYSAHDGTSSVGRYPDGGSAVYCFNIPTIASTNMFTSYVTEEQQHEVMPSGVERMIASSGNFRIRYGSEVLFVKSEEVQQVMVDIFTTDGRQVDQMATSVKGGTARVSVAHLPAGFYVARATDEQGNRVACKFMK